MASPRAFCLSGCELFAKVRLYCSTFNHKWFVLALPAVSSSLSIPRMTSIVTSLALLQTRHTHAICDMIPRPLTETTRVSVALVILCVAVWCLGKLGRPWVGAGLDDLRQADETQNRFFNRLQLHDMRFLVVHVWFGPCSMFKTTRIGQWKIYDYNSK